MRTSVWVPGLIPPAADEVPTKPIQKAVSSTVSLSKDPACSAAAEHLPMAMKRSNGDVLYLAEAGSMILGMMKSPRPFEQLALRLYPAEGRDGTKRKAER